MSRFLQAEIDLKALTFNFLKIKDFLKSQKPDCKIIAIIKADAYGHGAREVAKVLEKQKVDYLGVAFSEEAEVLRKSGIKSKILVFFDREDKRVFKYNLIPVIFDFKQAQSLSKQARKKGVNLPVHIKVETGMGRLGIYDKQFETIKKIAELPNIKIQGIMSHFSKAEDPEWTFKQIERFKRLKKLLNNASINPIFHISNSAGVVYSEAMFDAVRPGLMLYGYSMNKFSEELKPCMTVKTKLMDIRRLPKGAPISYGKTFITKRKSLIGVIPVGYADGYFRKLSNRASVIVKGKKAPVVGIVCMDLTMIDLTDIPDVEIEDEVILLGSTSEEKITAADIASWAETIPYEVVTSLGSKAKRKYIE